MDRPAEKPSELTVTVLNVVHDDEEILVLSGELDVQTMYTLRDHITHCLRRDQRRIRLDMAGVTQCEAGALHGVAGLQDALSATGGYLRITSVSEPVRAARNAVRLSHGIFGMGTPG